MRAAGVSETLVLTYQTTLRHIPEESFVGSYHCRNLKSEQLLQFETSLAVTKFRSYNETHNLGWASHPNANTLLRNPFRTKTKP
jgi:hypothetical protein